MNRKHCAANEQWDHSFHAIATNVNRPSASSCTDIGTARIEIIARSIPSWTSSGLKRDISTADT
eukprot:scaffold4418_cov130-Skeletonema_marinoi.AAC.1